jgi:asparagine synthase (glutamine-hydrolysing)
MLGALPCPAGFETRLVTSEFGSFVWRGVPGLGGLLESHVNASVHPVTVCVDGYVANLADLAKELGCPGQADAIVLTSAYSRWGIEFIARLDGSFALAVYDSQRKLLHLVRDRIGSMPLYWVQKAGRVAFASLPAAVCLGLKQPVKLVTDGIRREILALDVLAPNSVFEGVAAVEPGRVVSVSEASSQSHRYSDLANLRVQGATDGQLVTMMREGIRDGVGWYLGRPQSSVAVAFSGGLDSSVVLGGACQDPVQRDQVLAVTAVVSGKAEADRKYAEVVTKHCGVRWECFASEALDIPDALLAYAANPARVADLALSWEVFSKAKLCGRNTVLTGAVGDIIGGVGWGWQLSMLRGGQFRSLLREHRDIGLNGPRLIRAILGVAARFAWYGFKGSRWASLGETEDLGAILDLVGATGTERRELKEECLALAHQAEVPSSDYTNWLAWALGQYAPGELEAFGLLGRVLGMEVGFPLTHSKVLSTGLSLPWSLRRREGLTRVALREAAKPWIPNEVVARREKLEFSDHLLPMWRCMTREARRTNLIRHAAGFVDPDAWNALCDRQDILPSYVVCVLYEVTVLARWLRLNAAGLTGNETLESHGTYR